MKTLSLSRDMPYPPDAVFDVISDIARYPEFMPGFKDTAVEAREGDVLRVRQTVGAGGLTRTFLSCAVFTVPERIDIESHEAPFEVLKQVWRFEPLAQGARTRVHLEARYRMADPLAGAIFQRVFPGLLRGGLTAVGRRVAALHRRESGRRG
jgi:coenzyme Q-binding protein COQ10